MFMEVIVNTMYFFGGLPQFTPRSKKAITNSHEQLGCAGGIVRARNNLE